MDADKDIEATELTMERVLTTSHLTTQEQQGIYVHAHGIRPLKHMTLGHMRLALQNVIPTVN